MPGKADTLVSSPGSSGHADSSREVELIFYPAFCYNASPTWFAWVKLTAHDIHHRLNARQNTYAGPASTGTNPVWPSRSPLLLFYLNHPIQFVQLVGVVVTFEDYYERFWLFTIDDSSGATIEVNCRKPVRTEVVKDVDSGPEKDKDIDADARYEAMSRVDIGVVVQVKGRVATFRDIRQLQLERINIICETNQEMKLVGARVEFKDKVLSRPWKLSQVKQKRLKELALGESEEQSARSRKRQKMVKARAEQDIRHAAKVMKQYEREENMRQIGAEEARTAGLMLKSGN